MKQHQFKEYWESMNASDEEFSKSQSLSENELKDIRAYIKALQEKDMTSKNIISHLQGFNKKISELWKAERVYWTETKKQDTKTVGVAGEELEIKNYKTILSPNACKTCLMKSNNGTKIYKSSDLQKAGYGHVPPYHPNCYCVVIPKI